MELPIDHFRLIGVSPSAGAEEVLRNLQLRLDRPPAQGFTHEVLNQRAELLRLSADLLTNQDLREEYEAALLRGASGLELSSNREVAGLILLWEAEVPDEAFKLARKSLQPPQAPALGSGREADLTLIAALSCRDAALQEQELRHYVAAADLLQEGIHLLQRMGKLSDQQKNLEKDLQALMPYRILDLLSRDLSDAKSHQEGLFLLDSYVLNRGGLEGKKIDQRNKGLKQKDFELFFQQIRKFLTVQEQVDLFINWQKAGSEDSGFLVVMALVASGFSCRKPERLKEARKYLRGLNLQALDSMPLLGCIELLLADVDQARNCFKQSEDRTLQSWLDNYPGEELAAFCDYCRNWLKRDVLPGYRDVDYDSIDLESWFADRDVQEFIEKTERNNGISIAKAGFAFFSSLKGEKPDKSFLIETSDNSQNISPDSSEQEDSKKEELDNTEASTDDQFTEIEGKKSIAKSLLTYFSNLKVSTILVLEKRISLSRNFYIRSAWIFSILLMIGAMSSYYVVKNKRNNQELSEKQTKVDSKLDEDKKQESKKPLEENSLELKSVEFVPLNIENPNDEQIRSLLEAWLSNKASLLSGNEANNLFNVSRDTLAQRVEKERLKDLALGESQLIRTKINSIELISRTSKRIAVRVEMSYEDKRLNSSGAIISETTIPALKVTYILGRQKDIWKLVDYISGM